MGACSIALLVHGKNLWGGCRRFVAVVVKTTRMLWAMTGCCCCLGSVDADDGVIGERGKLDDLCKTVACRRGEW